MMGERPDIVLRPKTGGCFFQETLWPNYGRLVYVLSSGGRLEGRGLDPPRRLDASALDRTNGVLLHILVVGAKDWILRWPVSTGQWRSKPIGQNR